MAASWDDADFSLAPLSLEPEEEAFVAPKAPEIDEEQQIDDDRPALLLDLAMLAAQEQQVDAHLLREQVLTTLRANWTTKSGELMAAGMCWHVPAREADERRVAYEASHPGATVTVIHYPTEVDGTPTSTLVDNVLRHTPWEVLDTLKDHVAKARRPLKWQADFCVELEELAEQDGGCAPVSNACLTFASPSPPEREARPICL